MQKQKTFTFSVTLNIILIIVVLLGLVYIFVQPDISNFQGSSFTIEDDLRPAAEAKAGAITIEYNYDEPKINDQEYVISSFNITNDYEPALIYGVNLELEGDLNQENFEDLKVFIDKEELEKVEFLWKGDSSLIVNFLEDPVEVDGLSRFELHASIISAQNQDSIKVHFINLNSEGLETGQNITNIGVLGGPDPTPLIINF